jgi:D-3-phosphoglycerate dehydrogenase
MTVKKFKVLVTAPRALDSIDRYEKELGAAGCEVVSANSTERLEEHELLPLVHDIDAIVCGDDRITSRVLDAAPRLRVIAKWGTGIDSIDVEDAKRRGIAVRNSPGAFSDPVADNVLGYILLFARRLDRMAADMNAGHWQRLALKSVGEYTLGIIGLGESGKAVARRAAAFGMTIISSTLNELSPEQKKELGVELVPLQTLLSRSDFVSLHTDLRPENRHLIDAAHLRLMKPSAILINTARGELVDEDALVTALQDRRIGGAALDVFQEEPLPPTSPLRNLANVYLAPHNANASFLAAERVHANSIRNVLTALEATTQL